VANVLTEHCTQVPLADDQYAVGEFGSQGADEPFGETVRLRASRSNPDGDVALCEAGAGEIVDPGWSDRPGQLVEGSQDP
jgi:hypothetical protein